MRFLKALGILGFVIAGAAAPAIGADEASLHDFTVTSIERDALPLANYEGKAVLVVNTASYCGFTPQYEGLQAVWDEYRDQGLVVLGVPSNDFGSQEPGGEETIKKFCSVNYQVDFPMTKKMVVNGKEGTADLYNWFAARLGEESRPKWNFHKVLVGRDGQPISYFGSRVKPESKKLTAAIEAALGETGR